MVTLQIAVTIYTWFKYIYFCWAFGTINLCCV